MASPEVQRPMASPTNPGVGTVSSRKVVTFDRRYMSPSSRGRSGPTSSSALDVASARGVAQPQRPSVPSRLQTLARSDQKSSGRLRSTRPPGGGRRGRSCGRHSFRNHPDDKDPSNKASPDPEVSDRRVGGADEGGASGAAAPVGGPGPEAAAKRFRPTYSMNLRKRRHPAGVDGHHLQAQCQTAPSSGKRWKGPLSAGSADAKPGSSAAAEAATAATSTNASKAAPASHGETAPAKGNKTKFLLGGNIRDPLNLNSLADERLSRIVNAVTPVSSPIPTPKHRKAEYKVEVLIPPNISDPLNLMSTDGGEDDDDDHDVGVGNFYDSQMLLSSLLGRRKRAMSSTRLKKIKQKKKILQQQQKGDSSAAVVVAAAASSSSSEQTLAPPGVVMRRASSAPQKQPSKSRHYRGKRYSLKPKVREDNDSAIVAVDEDVRPESASVDSTPQEKDVLLKGCSSITGEDKKGKQSAPEVAHDIQRPLATATDVNEVPASQAAATANPDTAAQKSEEESESTIGPDAAEAVDVAAGKAAEKSILEKSPTKSSQEPLPPPPPSTSSGGVWKKPHQRNRKRKGPAIVSPVLPPPQAASSGGSVGAPGLTHLKLPHHHQQNRRPRYHRGKFSGRRPSAQPQPSCDQPGSSRSSPTRSTSEASGSCKRGRRCFEYGNYNRYYGYRNVNGMEDQRLQYLAPDWFCGKDVLDVGCNVGHVTLAVARNFKPRSILGVDIDEGLVSAAKKNVKHYTSCIIPEQLQTPQYYGGGSFRQQQQQQHQQQHHPHLQSGVCTPKYSFGGGSSGGTATPQRTSSTTPNPDYYDSVRPAPGVKSVPGREKPRGDPLDSDPLFPACMPILYGPIDPTNPALTAADSVRGGSGGGNNSEPTIAAGNSGGGGGAAGNGGVVAPSSGLPFPQNVKFVCSNYVLESDDLLDVIQPEFDAILCLSTTKWIHLNFGDDGIKRAFKRMFAQLRPGGKLILESQDFGSYKKRKNLTPRIKENFQNIRFMPDGFRDYLLHELNFASGETIAVPSHNLQGFQRPLQVFSKAALTSSRSGGASSSCQTTPYYAYSSRNTTPYYYYSQSPHGMFPPPRPGRPPCYAPTALTPMYSSNWPELEGGFDQPEVNRSSEPETAPVNPSSTTPYGYSPSGRHSATPSATPTGSGPPSTSNSPFGAAHGSPPC